MNKLIVILTALFGAGALYWFWKKNQPVYTESGLRMFSQSECKALGSDAWYDRGDGYGECINPSGGSWTWHYRKQD